ncbi:hypothetical protein QZH56_37080 (plasmid) [Streptomyces olivoreticuli]|uniref:hypothetical protein n=1 Tax=Streptomyces olivoreticuli TaxID=68246 RepID=UPI00265A1E33|nr:hypothetical protein [Streptomyces olivoreticuli]WKK20925.1 hypothetical protein QZH56_18685 [Streptomyces olivoreticuli]WKK21929.1 hypothetical protein QZH56_24340 [Streptomyces olivoreticuli]WKK22233.1 hypothetical protein QZH56_26035 [Streptomyces olivoreticuli]WKK22815.1 hypothetical protein QZH56_29295 [Streptomyces olivoreticuli]WKK23740.1 hypothetical protein QZH56_34455 [Streptomyces olivoreticuli]
MTSHNPVQERLDELDEREASARQLLERTLRLAGRQLDHDRPGDQVLRLAVCFHRRAEGAAAELDDTIAYLERT